MKTKLILIFSLVTYINSQLTSSELFPTHFTATLAGEVYYGIPDQYLTIRKEWDTGYEQKVNFDIPVNIVPGGKSYPHRIAIQRGPYIMSADSSLNASFGADNIISLFPKHSIPELQNAKEKLPAQWIDKQVYSLTVIAGKKLIGTLVLVPFSDASQTGARAQVWLPISNSKQ